jgi:cell division protease FtsH
MSDRLGMVSLAARDNPYLGVAGAFAGEKPFGEQTAEVIDAEVQRIIGECHEQAKRLLRTRRRELDALVGALLERETLDQPEILAVSGLPPPPESPSERAQEAVSAAGKTGVAAAADTASQTRSTRA